MSAPTHLTLGSVAQRCGCKAWQVRRLFERGLLPPAPRIGSYRVVAVEDLPKVELALRKAGYLKEEEITITSSQ
jgi:DNA-binding transcriptional MerR regulator